MFRTSAYKLFPVHGQRRAFAATAILSTICLIRLAKAATPVARVYVAEPSDVLSYLGDSGTRKVWNFPLKFSANNQFAYGAGCVGGLTTPYWAESFGILKRSTNGLLTYTSATAPEPPIKDNTYFFCRSLTAAS